MNQKQALIQEFVRRMRRHYGERLEKVVLYGSYARGDFHAESDIDFLVILRDEEWSTSNEVRDIVDETYELALEQSVPISAKPVPARMFKESNRLFFREVRQQGITVYE
jgi:predicted nucleotidyltransferase